MNAQRILVGCLVLLPLVTGAEDMEPEVMPTVVVPPVIFVPPEVAKEPVALSSVDVAVTIAGHIADTTMTMTFYNPNPRVLEGELLFPLPEGATVSGYGLDVEGVIVDGVVVEREAARVAFEKEVRKGVDPGLVEWVQGNTYRTRVYPIPERGTRTVRVRYTSKLLDDGHDAAYLLPLNFGEPVPEFHLRVEVVRSEVAPQVRGGGLTNFDFDRWEDRFVAETRLTEARLEEDLVIALPDVPRKQVAVDRTAGGEVFFAVHDLPEAVADRPPADPPRRIGVHWDASLSRAGSDHGRILGLLRQLLGGVEQVQVDLWVIRDAIGETLEVEVAGGDADAITEFLESVPYDGGTRLSDLAFPGRPPAGDDGPAYDYHLLISDGLGNLGDDLPEVVEAPVYAITVETSANHVWLSRLALASGGAAFNLARLTDDQVAEAIGRPVFSLLSVTSNPARVADVYPRTTLPVQGRTAVSGRLLAEEAEVTLNYGYGTHTVHQMTYVIRRADAADTGLVARFWAEQKVADLAVFPERNHDKLVSTGQRWGLVTPGTSLLVLETLEQHLEHGVEPPASRPELRRGYLQRLAELEKEEKVSRESKLEQVLEWWRERVEWWSSKFKYPPDFQYNDDEVARRGRTGGGRGRAAMAEPVPVASGASMDDAFSEEIEVASSEPLAESAAPEMKMKKNGDGDGGGGSTITLAPWDPDTPYLRALAKTGQGAGYDVYLEQREEHGSSPAFFLDCADHFFRREERDLALRVLTSVVELDLENPQLHRIVAYKLIEREELEGAIFLLHQVRRLRPEEPQSWRDLALALELRGDQALAAGDDGAALADYREALELLAHVVMGEWDRFSEIEVVALMEANALAAKIGRLPGGDAVEIPLDPRLVEILDLDVRIVLTWDTDLTDIDLWVIEPSGEKALYSHKLTTIGGLVSRDFTDGYGPEEYVLRAAMPGRYLVQANFYGSGQQTLSGPTTVQATVFTGFGRPEQARQVLTLRLSESKEVVDVGAIDVGGSGPTR